MAQFWSWRRFFGLMGIMLAANLAAARADPPRDWGGGGRGFALSVDRATKHGGRSSGTILSTDGGAGFGTFTQWFKADQYRGQRLRLTGWIKTEITGPAESGGGALWMRVDGKVKTTLVFDNMMNRMPTGSTDWKPYSVVLDIPAEADTIFFGFLLQGPGQAWVDDMKFDVVGQDIPTTALAVEPQDRDPGNPPLPTSRIEPKNLDFEW